MKVAQIAAAALALVGMNVATLAPARAQDPGISWANVGAIGIAGGTNCPITSAQGIVNGDTLSIIFSDFKVASTHGTKAASCALRVPIEVNTGFAVQPVDVQYLGFVNVPNAPGAKARLNSFITAGSDSARAVSRVFGPGTQDAYAEQGSVTVESFNARHAPFQSTMGLNTVISATGAHGQETMITVDTQDIQIGKPTIMIRFNVTPC